MQHFPLRARSAKHAMTTRILASASALALLGGCAGGYYHANPQGKEVSYKQPMLTDAERQGGTYVLLEKSVADGKYKVVDIAKQKQKIANSRQERVVFNSDLSAYAVDFDSHRWETYADSANYGTQTDIMRCGANPGGDKTSSYSPCSSDFRETFVPMGIIKAYTAGSMSYEAKKRWEDPRFNDRVVAGNPWYALQQSGAIEKLGIKRVNK
jgi:hypothetical protein